ncbi:MAG: hypothetical protein FJ319_08580 [SAR202 cluster bacterium]|nr:hypothetical protein [SAR202 cluster bacterium]
MGGRWRTGLSRGRGPRRACGRRPCRRCPRGGRMRRPSRRPCGHRAGPSGWRPRRSYPPRSR